VRQAAIPSTIRRQSLHERRASRGAMLADGAIGFLLEGLIGLGRRDVFVLSFFRGWVLFCLAFPFRFGQHSALRSNAPTQKARRRGHLE
jgi:hypothetical protein